LLLLFYVSFRVLHFTAFYHISAHLSFLSFPFFLVLLNYFSQQAAGGSAPELATSIMGLFVARTDVGFSTIVGSAVFNVLFVIGMCALASPQILVLTGWPLTRDSLYYSVTLLVLAMVYRFGTSGVEGNDLVTGKLITLERSIEWWEALL
jgi:hypothetical protein